MFASCFRFKYTDFELISMSWSAARKRCGLAKPPNVTRLGERDEPTVATVLERRGKAYSELEIIAQVMELLESQLVKRLCPPS